MKYAYATENDRLGLTPEQANVGSYTWPHKMEAAEDEGNEPLDRERTRRRL